MKKPKRLLLCLMAACLLLSLGGCWDQHELNTLFIVSAIALDEAKTPDNVEMTIQVARESEGKGSGEGGESGASVLMIQAEKSTASECVETINRDTSRRLFLHHNRAVVFGRALAEEGVKTHIDSLMRGLEWRMEVPIFVAEDSAGELISAEDKQGKISGLLLNEVVGSQSRVSMAYRVQMLDFISRLLDGSSAPVAPLIRLNEEQGQEQQRISLEGMAVFKEGQMIGQLDEDETQGYIWAMGPVRNSSMTASSVLGTASFLIMDMDCQRHVSLNEDGGIQVHLKVKAAMAISGLKGFHGMTMQELMGVLNEMGRQQLCMRLEKTFALAQEMQADIYGFGVMLSRQHPAAWEKLQKDWDAHFADIDFSTEAEVRVSKTGKTFQPLQLKEESNEN